MKRSLIKTGDYESPETKEFEMTPEGVLCASTLETTHDDMDYLQFQW